MQSFYEALEQGFVEDKPDESITNMVEAAGWTGVGDHSPNLTKSGWVFNFGAGGSAFELRFEPLLYDQQYYVALYRDGELLTNKVVIKPGKE